MIPENVRKNFTVVNINIQNHPDYIKLKERVYQLERQVSEKKVTLFGKKK